MSNPGSLAVGVYQLHVGHVDTGFLFDDTALGSLRVGFGVLGHHVDALYDDAVFVAEHFQNFSGFALVVTGIHIHGIAFLDIELFHNAYLY